VQIGWGPAAGQPGAMAYEFVGANAVHARNADGNTALHLAVQHRDIELAALLVRKGADILSANKLGQNPWQLAKANNDADMLRLFQDANTAFCTCRTLFLCPAGPAGRPAADPGIRPALGRVSHTRLQWPGA